MVKRLTHGRTFGQANSLAAGCQKVHQAFSHPTLLRKKHTFKLFIYRATDGIHLYFY